MAARFLFLYPDRTDQRMKEEFPIRLTEELILLMLNEQSGLS